MSLKKTMYIIQIFVSFWIYLRSKLGGNSFLCKRVLKETDGEFDSQDPSNSIIDTAHRDVSSIH